jgi:hypothetical protein
LVPLLLRLVKWHHRGLVICSTDLLKAHKTRCAKLRLCHGIAYKVSELGYPEACTDIIVPEGPVPVEFCASPNLVACA